MVVLRLRRGGRKHSPHYRLVIQEKRSKLNGAYIESIGHYHPTETNELTIDKDRAKYWLEQGAQVSDTVINLLVREGILPKTKQVKRTFVKPVTAEEVKTEEAAPAAAAEKAEEKAETKTEDEPAAEVAETADAEEKLAEETKAEETVTEKE